MRNIVESVKYHLVSGSGGWAKSAAGVSAKRVDMKYVAVPPRPTPAIAGTAGTFAGGSPSNAVYTPEATLIVTQGQPASYEYRSDSGTRVTRYFCRNCGTHLYGEGELFPGPWY